MATEQIVSLLKQGSYPGIGEAVGHTQGGMCMSAPFFLKSTVIGAVQQLLGQVLSSAQCLPMPGMLLAWHQQS